MPKKKEGKHAIIQATVPTAWLPFIHNPAISNQEWYNASARVRQIIGRGLAAEARETGSGFVYTTQAPALPLAIPVVAQAPLEIPPEVMPVPRDAPVTAVDGPEIKPLPPEHGRGGRGPGGLL